MSQNMPPLEDLELARFCSFIRWWLTRNSERTEIAKFEAQLWRPPPGEVGQGPWSAEAENAAFGALKAGLG